MGRRVLIATVGGLVVAGTVTAGVLAVAPAPNLVTALVLLAVVVPASAGLGTWLGLAITAQPDRSTAVRLAAFGAPVLTILLLFCVDLVIADPDFQSTQIASFVIGVALASGLAARFSNVA